MQDNPNNVNSLSAAEAQWRSLRENIASQASATRKPDNSDDPVHNKPRNFRERLNQKMDQIGNNVRLIDLYARQKDYYKIFELIGPWLGSAFSGSRLVKGAKPRDSLSVESEAIDQARRDVSEAYKDYSSGHSSSALHRWIEASTRVEEGITRYRDEKDRLDYKYKMRDLNNNLVGDTLNFGLQSVISAFSANWEKSMVVRTYENLAREKLGITGQVGFQDLKKLDNPIVQEAARYYSKKDWMRRIPDLAGLVRWIPKLYFMGQKAIHQDEWVTKRNPVNSAMWKIAATLDGIKMLLGAKTAFFTWYFLERQTGSFYEAESLWNKTEGISTLPNRGLNQNVLPGDFVTRKEISTLYQRFREENPELGLANFTPDDPLSSRIFEQVARYLNHTYTPRIFAITESAKQVDLPERKLSHAMLIELVGTKGLRVEDALGSVIRLEVMAHFGNISVKDGMRRCREVSEILEKIPHPNQSDYATLDEAIHGIHDYFQKLDGVAKRFLGDTWPPRYVERELKPGFIKFFFQDVDLTQEQVNYLSSAMAVLPKGHSYREYQLSAFAPGATIQIDGDERAPVKHEPLAPIYERDYIPKHTHEPNHHGPVNNSPSDPGRTPLATKPPVSHGSDERIANAPKRYTDVATPKDRSAIKPRSLTEYAAVSEEVPSGTIFH